MPAAFKIKRFITCGFAVGEVRGADEFPVGTDFAKLVADGAIRGLGDLAILSGDPKIDELMDQVEELTDRLAAAEQAAAGAGTRADVTVAERDREIAELKTELAKEKLRGESLENDLRAVNKPVDGAADDSEPAEQKAGKKHK
jgi:molybdopterin converting factor small subunit